MRMAKIVILSIIVAIDIMEVFIFKEMCIRNMQSIPTYIFGFLSWYLLYIYIPIGYSLNIL